MKLPLNGRLRRPPGRASSVARWFIFCVCLLGLAPLTGWAQRVDTTRAVPPMAIVALDSVAVAPSAIDTKGWLLLNPDIQTELDGAVHNLYNFKYDKAERQFRSLRRRYPEHPMPGLAPGGWLGRKNDWRAWPENCPLHSGLTQPPSSTFVRPPAGPNYSASRPVLCSRPHPCPNLIYTKPNRFWAAPAERTGLRGI